MILRNLVQKSTVPSAYYWDELLLLPAIRIADEVYISFSSQTVELLQRETLEFTAVDMWPPNCLVFIQFITTFGEWRKNESTKRQCKTWQSCSRGW